MLFRSLVVRNTDSVSLQIFDEEIRYFAPPGSTQNHLRNLMNMLERNKPGGTTSLAKALRRSSPLLRRKGTLVVLSDFLDEPPEIFRALSVYLHRGFNIHLFHVISPEERKLEHIGLRTFVDMENGGKLVVHSSSIADAYNREMSRHIESLRAMSVRRRIDYSIADTSTPYFQLFDRFSK